jgi:hypothetical protein
MQMSSINKADDDVNQAKHSLIYTIAFDGPGGEGMRFLVKMLLSSLLRTHFSGDIVVFHNSQTPLFLVERKGLQEVFLDVPPLTGEALAENAWCWKYRVAELIDASAYDKIMFLDADCLALRNVDHLLEGDWDIRYQPERGQKACENSYNAFFTEDEMTAAKTRTAVNSGTWAVRGDVYHEVMQKWREIDESERQRPSGFWDQASWNTLLMRHGSEEGSPGQWRVEPFARREIQFPMYLDLDFRNYRDAAITHNCGLNSLGKAEFTFGLYMRTFFFDPTGLFFSMLET